MPTVFRDTLSAGLASLGSGLILWLIQTRLSSLNWWLLAAVALLSGACVYFAIFVFRCKSLGISKILPSSVKGEGSTTSFMESAHSSICFVGIAAGKWVRKGDELEAAIRKVCSLNSGYIKFLLLHPQSPAARKLSLAGSQNADQVGTKIEKSIQCLQKIVDRLSRDYPQALSKFEIRLYNQMPVYRLAIIDNRRAYFSFYQLGSSGGTLKQFVIQPGQGEASGRENIFNSMSEYFDCLWNAPTTVAYDLTQSCEADKANKQSAG